MKRVLISVYDKAGIIDFAKSLAKLGWEIVSTGGSKSKLEDAGLAVKSVEDITTFPEILDGRVKTLNPRIHAGILYRRDNAEDRETIEQYEISAFDMVVNNLYPFEEKVMAVESTPETILDNIDIGGPSMIRAAAKNYKDVIIVTNPEDYNWIIETLEKDGLTIENRRQLAAQAFSLTAFYDSMIAKYFNEEIGEAFPKYLTKSYRFNEELRYGENPHQEAVFYEDPYLSNFKFEQLHGKKIFYNNYNDLRANLELLAEFDDPACVAVKHANPCGVAVGKDAYDAYVKANSCDPISIFGGIIAFNRVVDKACAVELSKTFLEIIAAVDFSPEAFEILSRKKNIRLLKLMDLNNFHIKTQSVKETLGGVLVQDKDQDLYEEDKLELVSDREATAEEMKDLLFAWKVVKHCDSNAMVVAKDNITVGLGHGQVRRVWSLENALRNAELYIEDTVVASDGFFFPDTIEVLHENGIKAIIQPGGSIQDEKVIEAANKYGISLYMTGMRHFDTRNW